MDDCEGLLHYGSTSEVARGADKILAEVQQYVHSRQDTTPVVGCDMEVVFSKEEQILLLVETLGEILVGKTRLH